MTHADHLCEMLPPSPGDPIIAHVSPGKGLVIHHESCRNIRGYQEEAREVYGCGMG